PLSGLRTPGTALAAGQSLLMDETFSEQHVPDVVLQFGGAPTSRATQRFVAGAERLVVIGPRPADPSRKATQTVTGDEEGGARALLDLAGTREQGSWVKEWTEADAVARGGLDGFLDAEKQP